MAEALDETAKQRLKELALELGAVDVGIASADAYSTPRSPDIKKVFPRVRSMVVMAYRELDSCDCDYMHVAMNGRLDLMSFSRSNNYRVARHLQGLGGKAMTVPVSYPLPMLKSTAGAVADVSTRHAAVAAGLGGFGRNNLVLHPELGSRVIFTVVMTDLEIPADRPFDDDVCTHCEACVENCPSGALDEEGKTDVLKCLKVCQPYGLGGAARFLGRLLEAGEEQRREMLTDDTLWKLYQACSLAFQYFCFNCIKVCPA